MRHQYICMIVTSVLFIFPSCTTETVDIEIPSTERNYQWDTASPSSVGLDSLRIESSFAVADSAGFLRSILVIKDGKAVAEKYYGYVRPESWHDLRSATKSFTSALVGIAIDKGLLRLNDKIAEILHEAVHAEADSRIYDVTIKDILQMKSGIGGDFYFENVESDQQTLIEYIINAPMQADPGDRFIYSSNSNTLLTAAIAKVSGKSAKEFADEFLCEPLGISISWWEKDIQGNNFGGGGLFLSTRNMAAFGYLFLNDGNLNGQQIISQNWVRASFNDEAGYGYLWWIGTLNGYKTYSARGFGGQVILIVPELNMVVAATCDTEIDLNQAYYQGDFILALIRDYILQ